MSAITRAERLIVEIPTWSIIPHESKHESGPLVSIYLQEKLAVIM